MLLIQDICLSWSKKEKNSFYAKKRAEFPLVYSLDKSPDISRGDALVHRLGFWQKEDSFQTVHMDEGYCFQAYASVKDLNLTNLSVRLDEENYEVTFFYDEHRSGQPVRRGHNKDYNNTDSYLYRHDILNETAFSLNKGQYGCVIWNERKTDYDTGEWYYELHIINLLNCLEIMLKQDIFLSKRPDFEYKQMAELY